jgi:hypothetical protein
MMNYMIYMIEEALKDFIQVAKLAHRQLDYNDFKIEYLMAPHKRPTALPPGKIAIYGFYYKEEWLKIGIVGPKSQARFTSQYYNPHSSPSNLAKSLMKDPEMSLAIGNNPGKWIETSCHRVNIFLSADKGLDLLALLESFLHVRLRPRYEK